MGDEIRRWAGAAALASLTVFGIPACERTATTPGADGSAAALKTQPGPAPAKAPVTGAPSASDADVLRRADRALADKVQARLAEDTALRRLGIDVTASNGAVTLFGTADSGANRDRAGKLAASVEGVRSVANQLVLLRGS